MPAPTEETLGNLRGRVILEDYDLGIAMDGDGDRLGIIDKNGSYIDANQILCLLYYYLVKYKGWNGPVVRNLATTHMLDRIAESFGEKCYEVPVVQVYKLPLYVLYPLLQYILLQGHVHHKD